MTFYDLQGYELIQMIKWLTSRGGVPHLLEFLNKVPGELGGGINASQGLHGKRMKFGEYDLVIADAKYDSRSMLEFQLRFRRDARFMGWIENRKLIRFLIDAAKIRFEGLEKQVEGIHRRGGPDLLGGFSEISWGRETTIKYSPWANGDPRLKHDWIYLNFYRKFD